MKRKSLILLQKSKLYSPAPLLPAQPCSPRKPSTPGSPPPTSWERSVGPSAPAELRNSSKEAPKARTAAYSKSDNHLNRQACSTRLRMIRVWPLALALARRRMKANVSVDQRPPTSSARTTSFALLHRCQEFRVRPLLASPGIDANRTICCGCQPVRSAVCVQWRDHRGVDGQLSTTMEWKAVSHDLQSPTIQCIGNFHVEVTDEDVRCYTSARFATCPCGCTL